MENIYTMKSVTPEVFRDQVSRAIMVSAAGDVSTMVWLMDAEQKVKNVKYVAFTPNSSAHYPLVYRPSQPEMPAL